MAAEVYIEAYAAPGATLHSVKVVGAGGVGIELKNVELGLALLTEQVTGNATPRNWTTVQATVGKAAFVGVNGLTIEVNIMGLSVNREASDESVVDYSLTASTTDASTSTIAARTNGPVSCGSPRRSARPRCAPCRWPRPGRSGTTPTPTPRWSHAQSRSFRHRYRSGLASAGPARCGYTP